MFAEPNTNTRDRRHLILNVGRAFQREIGDFIFATDVCENDRRIATRWLFAKRPQTNSESTWDGKKRKSHENELIPRANWKLFSASVRLLWHLYKTDGGSCEPCNVSGGRARRQNALRAKANFRMASCCDICCYYIDVNASRRQNWMPRYHDCWKLLRRTRSRLGRSIHARFSMHGNKW